MSTVVTQAQKEAITSKALIMNAAVTALYNRVQEYNPNDEIAEGVMYSVLELRKELEIFND